MKVSNFDLTLAVNTNSTATQAETIVKALGAIDQDSFKDDEVGRTAVVRSLRLALARVQTPLEQVFAQCFNHGVLLATIRVFYETDIWKAWVAAGSGEMSLNEIAQLAKTPMSTKLLGRLLKLLASHFIIEETGQDKYRTTPFSIRLGQDLGLAIQGMVDHLVPGSAHLPSFLASTDYAEPLDPKHHPYTEMPENPERAPFFVRTQDPALYASFAANMSVVARMKPDWTGYYDTFSLLEGADLEAGPFVVDMAGQFGRDLGYVQRRHPHLPAGSLVLEDQPDVIELAKTKGMVDGDAFKLVAFDLFKPQPVHGSRAYYMHAIFHSYPDAQILDMFDNLRPAMKKGYSKLLICDIVMPPTGASCFQATMDLTMMVIGAGLERTVDHWTELLTAGGFTNIKFFRDHLGMDCVIEADVA